MKTLKTPQIPKLTRKQEAFVRHLVENPKDSATEAVIQTYNIIDRNVAGVVASENLRKPSVVSELSKYNNLVENTLINTINEYSDSDKLGYRSLAVDTAKYIHDKVHGKATQKIESTSHVITIGIDLTQGQD